MSESMMSVSGFLLLEGTWMEALGKARGGLPTRLTQL
jgi:hypothetical protein